MASGSYNRSGTNRKRTSSSTGTKRKPASRKKSTVNDQVFDDIIMILSVALCIFLFLCNFGIIGTVGNAISKFMFGVFGLFAYAAPLVIAAAVIYYNLRRGDYVAIRKLWAMVCLCLLFAMVCELFSADLANTEKYDFVDIYTRCAQERNGGGILAGSITYGLYKLMSLVGTILVICVSAIIALIFLTERSLIGGVKDKGKVVLEQTKEGSERWHERSERKRVAAERRREENIERRSRLEEERKLRQEELENERILRMDKKVSGVMIDTSLKKADGEVKEKNAKTLPRDDMHEITLNELPEDVMDMQQIVMTRDNVMDDMHQINIPEVHIPEASWEPETQSQLIEPQIAGMPEPIIAKHETKPTANVPEPVTDAVAASVQKDINRLQNAVPKKYRFPSLELLHRSKNSAPGSNAARELKETALRLQETLKTFNVNVTVTDISQGPSVTRYELQPEQGVKVSKIVGLADDIKLNLAATDIRIEAPIPGKAAIGIEVPNKENMAVCLRDLLETKDFKDFPSKLAFAVGKDIGGKTVVADIAKMPHMLIAGSTGSGKSVCINSIIMSILYKATPDEVKLIMVDPKVVELSVYNGIPHLMIPVVTDPKKAAGALHWGVSEMTDRYKKFADMNVRDLSGYNKQIDMMNSRHEADVPPKMPQILIIVDELADLMMVAPGEVEESICRLAQLARAAGIHLIIATQRPSVDVITGLIKANMPSRVAFAVSSGVDSRTILDSNGAEKLLGKGDMLFAPQGYPKPARIQGAFVSDEEVSDVVDFLKNQNAGNYNEDVQEMIQKMETASGNGGNGGSESDSEFDEYFVDAGRFIIDKDKASIGMLQRAFKVGFNRAGRIMDQLYEAGVVGKEEGTKPRKVLMTPEQFEQYVEETI